MSMICSDMIAPIGEGVYQLVHRCCTIWYMASARGDRIDVTDATTVAGPRDRLLAQTVDYVRDQGFSDVSLRELAAAIGTSHRMLIYHFGSKEALLVEVIRAFERAQRDLMTTFVVDSHDEPADVLRRIWRQVSDPRNVAQVRMFF